GALVTEIVFSYPGLGYLILQAINNQDFFLIQGAFLFIIIGVLLANSVTDMFYVLVDPRTRVGMRGGALRSRTPRSWPPPPRPRPRPPRSPWPPRSGRAVRPCGSPAANASSSSPSARSRSSCA